MITRILGAARTERRAATLAAIIVAQALCAMFFIGDVVADFLEDGHLDALHLVLEAGASVALMVGVVYLMVELRGVLARMERMEAGLQAARGEMAEIVETFFDLWALSPAERDVALLLLKGVSMEEIAEARGTAKGTVRAQSAAVYAKAGVEGRAQLTSLFLEELLDGRQERQRPPEPVA